ncbi:hypothetical protein F5Y12DRAFT_556585 [Xylaria sp. FL1777]|nr:hypothetical protein F5Y12DRAFT_556585 [Xylaria sp. FL1777]
MEPTPIFTGLEVAGPQHQGGHSIPQLSEAIASEEITSYYISTKNRNEQFDNPGCVASDLPPPEAKKRANRRWVFTAPMAAAVTAIIVGAAVGGGLGSALSSCQKDLRLSRNASFADLGQCTNGSATLTQSTRIAASSTTCLTAFQTTTNGQIINYEAVPSKNVSTLGADCDTLQKGWQVTSQGERFSALCKVQVGFKPGAGRTDGNGNPVTQGKITTLIAYSLSDCLEACSGYTYTSKQRGKSFNESCGSVVFRTNLADNYYANCLLLNSTVTHKPGTAACDECISATKIE